MRRVFPKRRTGVRAKPAVRSGAVAALVAPLPAGSAALFCLVLPLELAPTMNVYASMPGWQRAKLRRAVDAVIVATAAKQGRPLADGARRRVLVTRCSSREVDEVASDTAGAKIALDRLVIAGILAGDSRKWLERAARWERAKPGEGRLVVEVFEASQAETASEGSSHPEAVRAREPGPGSADYPRTGVQRKKKRHDGPTGMSNGA